MCTPMMPGLPPRSARISAATMARAGVDGMEQATWTVSDYPLPVTPHRADRPIGGVAGNGNPPRFRQALQCVIALRS